MKLEETTKTTQIDHARLCSAEFIRCMRTASSSCRTWQELAITLANAFPPLAKSMKIGYSVIVLSFPPSTYIPQGQHSETILCGKPADADMQQQEQMVFRSLDNGTFTLVSAPFRDAVWTEAERDQIRFLAESVYMLCGYARREELLRLTAMTDRLTGVMNMTGIIQYGHQLRQMGWLRNYVGMFFNLKNFKYINQTVGQASGDLVLTRYCRAVQAQLQPDERMGRPGGDNFVLIVRRENAGRILGLLAEVPLTISVNGNVHTFQISANVGAYEIQPDDTIESTLDRATIALNTIRYSGYAGDQLWYEPGMQEKMMREKRISQLFSMALRNGEFRVYYQPKVALETRKLCGSEALCRWYHDDRIVPPMDFIPVLEKDGTVCDLDFYMFEQVCRDIRDWLDRGIDPVRVSINFSQKHLHDEDLAQKIIGIMQKYNINSRYIEVELTEMSGNKNHDAMLAFLGQMHDHGICTSIDDFGTGYSSLNMLREFQMDIIKLDKSFLDRITADNNDYKMDEIVVENIIRMAQSLNLEIISEGVETCRQADFLKSVHCDMAQGYLFDKPLPHDEFEMRLLGNRFYPKKEG